MRTNQKSISIVANQRTEISKETQSEINSSLLPVREQKSAKRTNQRSIALVVNQRAEISKENQSEIHSSCSQSESRNQQTEPIRDQ